MPIEKLGFDGVNATENKLTLTQDKINELIETVNELKLVNESRIDAYKIIMMDKE